MRVSCNVKKLNQTKHFLMKSQTKVLSDPAAFPVSLSLLEEKDVPFFFKLVEDNREALAEWLPSVMKVKNQEEVKKIILKSQEQYLKNTGYHFGIRVDNQLAGYVGLHELNWEINKTKMGYWLGQSFQGRGFASLACSLLIRFAFNSLQLDTVEIECAEDNSKSIALPKKLGFSLSQKIPNAEKIQGHESDRLVYVMTRKEWNTCEKKFLNSEKKI
jgi:ribosomal-protein-serine acetyltransferase